LRTVHDPGQDWRYRRTGAQTGVLQAVNRSSVEHGPPADCDRRVWYKKDRYGRLVGTVYLKGVDVGLEQVRAGLAWHYKRYANEQTSEQRTAYELPATGRWLPSLPVSFRMSSFTRLQVNPTRLRAAKQ
jgi:hypothetical protein